MTDVDWRVRDDRSPGSESADASSRLRESAYLAWERSVPSARKHHGYGEVKPEKDVVIVADDTWALYGGSAHGPKGEVGDKGAAGPRGDLYVTSQATESIFRAAVNDRDVRLLLDLGKSKAELEQIRLSVERHGQGPEPLLSGALKANRVVAVGDLHATPNPQRDLGARMMEIFRAGGATHLALELPRSMQTDLDRFSRTGDLDVARLPVTLRQPEYMRLLRAARAAGLKLVAVDEDGNTSRDAVMARGVASILDGDRSAKVILWVGSNHLQDAPGQGEGPSTAELLRQRYPIFTVLDQSDQNLTGALARMTRDIKQPTAVVTDDSAEVARLDTFRPGQLVPQKYGYWDAVVIYPGRKTGAFE